MRYQLIKSATFFQHLTFLLISTRTIQFSGKQLNYLMILVSLNTKIRVLRVLRDNPRFAAYSPKCDLHSDNLKIE